MRNSPILFLLAMGILAVSTTTPAMVFGQNATIPTFPQPSPGQPTVITPNVVQTIVKEQDACLPTYQSIADTLEVAPEDMRTKFDPYCVYTPFGTDTLVVLNGDLLIGGARGDGEYVPNLYISAAVSDFQQQGYKINSVNLAGQGSEANPHSWYVVMSK